MKLIWLKVVIPFRIHKRPYLDVFRKIAETGDKMESFEMGPRTQRLETLRNNTTKSTNLKRQQTHRNSVKKNVKTRHKIT